MGIVDQPARLRELGAREQRTSAALADLWGDTEPLLLVRWYQMAQYMPHHARPLDEGECSPPFLYGSDADDAMKHSLRK